MNSFIPLLKKHWLWLVANLGAAYPLVFLIWDFWIDNLGINPIATITTRTGKAAIILLLLSLACTPANLLLGWPKVLNLRKSLGLWAFSYVSLHLLIFVGLDYGFNLQLILGDTLLTKRYIVVGFSAFLLLLPLALTSTKWWMKRLGRNWKKLHRLVYVAGGLAALHFIWLVKPSRLNEPLIYAGVLALLLLFRLPPVRKFISKLRPAAKARTIARPAAQEAPKRPMSVQG